MRSVDEVSLRAVIERSRQRRQSISVALCVKVGVACCEALKHAANPRPNLPRVVRPETFLLSEDSEDAPVRLLLKYWDAHDPGIGRHFCYLSPEEASGFEHDQRADVFAIGAILWELLAGRILFLGDTDSETAELAREAFVPAVAEFNSQVDSDLEAIVRTALAKHPASRYETVEQLGAALSAYLSRRGIVITGSDLRALRTLLPDA